MDERVSVGRRETLHVSAQDDRPQVRLERRAGLEAGRLVGQPAADVHEVGGGQSVGSRLGRLEVDGPEPAVADRRQHSLDRRDVPRTSALGNQPATRPEDGGEVAEQRVAVDRMASTGSAIGIGRPRSATRNSIREPKRASRERAPSIIEGDPSTATTAPRGRRSASSSVTLPLPQPASMTRSSPRSGSLSSTAAPQAVIGFATRS